MKDIDAQLILEAWDNRDEQGPVAQVGRGLDEIVQNIKNFFNNGQVDIPNTGNWVELTDDPDINLAGELEVIMIGIVKGAHVEPPFKPDKPVPDHSDLIQPTNY